MLFRSPTHEAAGALQQVELGERRLHWLKNVTEPVAARLVEEPVRSDKSQLRRLFCSFKAGPMPLGGTA